MEDPTFRYNVPSCELAMARIDCPPDRVRTCDLARITPSLNSTSVFRRTGITSSVVLCQLRRHVEANPAIQCPVFLSFALPSDDDIIESGTRVGLNQIEYVTRSGHRAHYDQNYFLCTRERTVTHYFPCAVCQTVVFCDELGRRTTEEDLRESASHWNRRGLRSESDANYARRFTTDILYWRCEVCQTVYTDERFTNLMDGITAHLSSAHHVFMRRKRRYPTLPWPIHIEDFMSKHWCAYPMRPTCDIAHDMGLKGKGKGKANTGAK